MPVRNSCEVARLRSDSVSLPTRDAGIGQTRTVHSIAWNWAGLIVNASVLLVTIPLMIHRLGNFYYGLWVLLNTIIGHYGLLDLGTTNSLQRFTSRFDGSNESGALRETVAAALHITTATSVLVLAVSLILAYAVPGLLRIPHESVRLFRELLLLMGASVAVTFPARTLSACLQGFHRFDFYNLGVITTSIVRAGSIAAALCNGHGIIAVCMISCGTAFLSCFFSLIALRHLDRELFVRYGSVSWRPIREFFSFSFFVFLRHIGDYFRFQLDSIVIARCLGIALVTPFSVAATLMNYFSAVLFAISTPLMTRQGRLDGAGRLEEGAGFFLRGTKLTMVAAILGGLLLICNGKVLLRVWAGKELVSVYPVLVVLTVAYVSDLAQAPTINLLCSRNRHQALAYWTVLEGIANLLLSVALVRRYGILGVALGTTVPLLFTKLVIQPWYVLRVFGMSGRGYFLTVIRPIIVGAATSLGYKLAFPPASDLRTLCLSIAGQTLLYAVLAYRFILDADERRSLSSHLKMRLRPAV